MVKQAARRRKHEIDKQEAHKKWWKEVWKEKKTEK
jgi:hypothetical protein